MFYDLISRVLPGFVVLTVGALVLDGSIDGLILSGAFGAETSAWLVAALLFAASYLTGQILAPVSILIERKCVARAAPSYFSCLQMAIVPEKSGFAPSVQRFLADQLRDAEESDPSSLRRVHYYTTTLIWFDWVRMRFPDAGARLAKIRAEYRMHGQLATGFTIILLLHVFTSLGASTAPHLGLSALLAVLAGLSFSGEARMSQVFQWSVIHHYYVGKGMPPSDQ